MERALFLAAGDGDEALPQPHGGRLSATAETELVNPEACQRFDVMCLLYNSFLHPESLGVDGLKMQFSHMLGPCRTICSTSFRERGTVYTLGRACKVDFRKENVSRSETSILPTGVVTCLVFTKNIRASFLLVLVITRLI